MSTSFDFSKATILCIGDVMLDRFVYGQVERISPESPVPVLRMNREFTILGGAGNVARNISSLGGNVIFVSVCGNDTAGNALEDQFEILPQVQATLIQETHRQTTQKTRFIAQGQQLLRVDEEVIRSCLPQTEDRILNLATEFLPLCQVLILSDYNKGVLSSDLCQKLIQLARQHEIPIIADPKGRDYKRYSGATLITPNLKELGEVAGVSLKTQTDIEEAAHSLQQALDIEAILVTQGAQGMTLVDGGKDAQKIPAQAREVYDVSGAGDTVVATLAAALGSGVRLIEACRLANTAAGIVVGKVGTAAVTAEELQSSFDHQHSLHTEQKVLTLAQSVELLKEWRRQGYKVGFTNGCFDLLHLGHLHILQEAAAACDKLIIGLNSDLSIKRLKGESRPAHCEETRAQVLAALGMVDAVIIFEEDTPYNLIETLLPDVLIKGADYTIDRVIGADLVQSRGGEVLLVTLKPGHSTTNTLKKIA